MNFYAWLSLFLWLLAGISMAVVIDGDNTAHDDEPLEGWEMPVITLVWPLLSLLMIWDYIKGRRMKRD